MLIVSFKKNLNYLMNESWFRQSKNIFEGQYYLSNEIV